MGATGSYTCTHRENSGGEIRGHWSVGTTWPGIPYGRVQEPIFNRRPPEAALLLRYIIRFAAEAATDIVYFLCPCRLPIDKAMLAEVSTHRHPLNWGSRNMIGGWAVAMSPANDLFGEFS